MPDMSEAVSRINARDINETIRYTNWTAFHIDHTVADSLLAGAELEDLIVELATADIELRGIYDITAFRADAQFVLWFHAAQAEQIQLAVKKFGHTSLGRAVTPVWAAMGLHRPAEFNKGHVPAFMAGAPAKKWLSLYPFVRSYDWYLLPEEERRAMLIEHGMKGREYSGIISNTVSAFALGDYEWILALESDDLHEIVDMMRELRSTQARRHVREEIPFYTGRLVEQRELVELFT